RLWRIKPSVSKCAQIKLVCVKALEKIVYGGLIDQKFLTCAPNTDEFLPNGKTAASSLIGCFYCNSNVVRMDTVDIYVAQILTVTVALLISSIYFANKIHSSNHDEPADSSIAFSSGKLKEQRPWFQMKLRKSVICRLFAWKVKLTLVTMALSWMKDRLSHICLRVSQFLRGKTAPRLFMLRSWHRSFRLIYKMIYKSSLPAISWARKIIATLSRWMNKSPVISPVERNNPLKAYFANRAFYSAATVVPWMVLVSFFIHGIYMEQKISRVEKVQTQLQVQERPQDEPDVGQVPWANDCLPHRINIDDREVSNVVVTFLLFSACKLLWEVCSLVLRRKWKLAVPFAVHILQRTIEEGWLLYSLASSRRHLICTNLPNTDVFSKSDPMCVMFKKAEQGDWQEAGRSEVVRNNLNPDFVHKFTIDYEFEARQPLKFEIYDVDSASAKLEKHDFLGRVECTLAELVSEPRFESVLLDGPGREQMESKEEVSFNIRAENLDNKRFLCKSNPQLAIYRVNEDTSWTIVYRTEVARRCLNPVWQPFSIGTSQLCCSDHYRTLRFRCIDWHGSGSETLIGEFETNLVDLIAASENGMAHFELINGRKKRKKATYENSGKIIIKTSITVVDSFLDYVKAGTHLSCAFAIDFTASNGDPRKPQSLHYFHPYLLNPYQMAIRAVGDVVKDYDSDKLFPVLGFGARLPPDGRVSHDFNVNGNSTNPFCTGIEGVLQAYGACLQSVQLAGPTNFAPVISHVARLASAHMDGSKYFILLIITDGVISDMPKTQEAIVDASTLPLSLIIVGVGEGDFTEMRILDGDQVRLSSKGKTAERDIFVSMRDFAENMTAQSSELTAARLSREVLAEIPFQFLSFMKSKGITPDDVRKMNRCHKASQHVSNASASKGLNTALEAPPPYETMTPFGVVCLLRRELLCIKAIGHTTLRLLTHRAPVTLKCLQSRDWLRCKRLAHDGSKEESKASTSLDKSPKQSDQQESLIMKVLMEEDKAPKTRIEKVAQAGKDLSYLTIIIVCVALTGTIAYTVIHELFSSNRPNAIHSKTLKLLLANEQIVDILGLPIKSKGETNRGGRSRHVRYARTPFLECEVVVYVPQPFRHFEFERNDRQFMRMVFHVTGSRKKGTVQLELEKLQDNAGKYQYRYVLFQSNDHPKETVVLVDKRDELPLGPHSADNFKNKSTA
ncbi:LOW QUALITY PROTEIN: hypothetical protein M514_10381, partial [Trichuris suis]